MTFSSPGTPRHVGGRVSLSVAVGESATQSHTQGHTGGRCLSTCSEDHKARQQRATPPCRAGGRPQAASSWPQARYLILPAGQAGRHKRWSQEGREGRGKETDAERPGRWTERLTGRSERWAVPQPTPDTPSLPSAGASKPDGDVASKGAMCVPGGWDPEDLGADGQDSCTQVPGSLHMDLCLHPTSPQALQAPS